MSKKRRAKIPPFRVLNSENIFRKFVSKIMRSCDKNFAQLHQDVNVCITNASYDSENNEFQITVSGVDLENNASPYACQFVLKVNDKKYRLRGGIVEWKK